MLVALVATDGGGIDVHLDLRAADEHITGLERDLLDHGGEHVVQVHTQLQGGKLTLDGTHGAATVRLHGDGTGDDNASVDDGNEVLVHVGIFLLLFLCRKTQCSPISTEGSTTLRRYSHSLPTREETALFVGALVEVHPEVQSLVVQPHTAEAGDGQDEDDDDEHGDGHRVFLLVVDMYGLQPVEDFAVGQDLIVVEVLDVAALGLELEGLTLVVVVENDTLEEQATRLDVKRSLILVAGVHHLRTVADVEGHQLALGGEVDGTLEVLDVDGLVHDIHPPCGCVCMGGIAHRYSWAGLLLHRPTLSTYELGSSSAQNHVVNGLVAVLPIDIGPVDARPILHDHCPLCTPGPHAPLDHLLVIGHLLRVHLGGLTMRVGVVDIHGKHGYVPPCWCCCSVLGTHWMAPQHTHTCMLWSTPLCTSGRRTTHPQAEPHAPAHPHEPHRA